MQAELRWLIRRDMDEVLSIENRTFQYPWTEEEFVSCLRSRNCIGSIAERGGQIVGFMIKELHKSTFRILSMAVDPDNLREGIGRQMVQSLIEKLSNKRRNEIMLEVRETNVSAQLFFAKHGFIAVDTLRGHYVDTSEDAYLMRYALPDAGESLPPYEETEKIY